mgnify:CR=1 FL=1|tara:strand:- start:10087 stop:10371 length:285 start_codon:yes stop_codon:yes gene_type:complete
MDIETIKRLHSVYDDMILGNMQLAHKELGKIINDQYLTLTAVGCSLPSKEAMFIEELQEFAKEKEWDERVNRSDFSKGFISCYKWITNQKFKVR